jgi:FtsH-binding integral membrane protein
MNGKWQYFLNSLATVGGNLFLLAIFVGVFLGLVLFVLHDTSANVQVVTTITSAFTGFSGALLLALKGRTTDTNPSTGGGTTTSSTTTETTSPINTPKP